MLNSKKTFKKENADKVIKRVFNKYINTSLRCSHKLSKRRNEEALHDTRVCIRQLRSSLEIYKELLIAKVYKDISNTLRTLIHPTGAVRDSEVQIMWLKNRLKRIPKSKRRAVNSLVIILKNDVKRGYAQINSNWIAKLQKSLKELNKSSYLKPMKQPFKSVFLRLVCIYISKTNIAMGRIKSRKEREAIHEARIKVKELRYLLFPFVKESKKIGIFCKELNKLQGILGKLHDNHLLQKKLKNISTDSSIYKLLKHHAKKEELELYMKFKRRWLKNRLKFNDY